jgi:septum formation protein
VSALAITLCSTSPFRAALLRSVSIPFAVVAPPFEEIADPSRSPKQNALHFAEQKARSVKTAGLRIGCDQALELDGRMLRKPEDRAGMRAQLAVLSGKTHHLHSAVSVFDGTRCVSECVSIALTMRWLAPVQIETYLTLDNPIGAVGSYYYEKHGRLLFEQVTPADDSAIIGLPLLVTLRLLRAFDIDLLQR